MLTEVDFSETQYDTSFREYNPEKDVCVIRHNLQQQKPSELGVVYQDGIVTRSMKVGPWWSFKEELNTHERFPQKYKKLNIEVQEKVSSIQESQKENTRQAMFTVYKSFMDFEREKDYASCDDLLRSLDVAKLDLKVIMSLLMASNPIKEHLSYRQTFYMMVSERSYLFDSFDKVKVLFDRLK